VARASKRDERHLARDYIDVAIAITSIWSLFQEQTARGRKMSSVTDRFSSFWNNRVPTRLKRLLLAICTTASVVLLLYALGIGSTYNLAIVATILVVAVSLIYIPLHMLRTLAIIIICVVICLKVYFAQGWLKQQNQLILSILFILIGLCLWFYWATLAIAQANDSLFKKLDYLQKRIDYISDEMHDGKDTEDFDDFSNDDAPLEVNSSLETLPDPDGASWWCIPLIVLSIAGIVWLEKLPL
jgi:hypothetical protein